ncbi:hypothetical protein NHJ13734_006780 [Beauveria thailandica]
MAVAGINRYRVSGNAQAAAGGIETSVNDNTSCDAGFDSRRESAGSARSLVASHRSEPGEALTRMMSCNLGVQFTVAQMQSGHHEELQTGISSGGSGDHAAEIAALEVPREDEAGKHTRVNQLGHADDNLQPLTQNAEQQFGRDNVQKDVNADANADTNTDDKHRCQH